MDISYDHFRVFYYAAKYESFTRAAAALGSNQPNVSRAVKKLEDELCCRLFTRTGRSISLTPEGRQLYGHVSIAFEHLAAAQDEISSGNSLEAGLITIAANEIALRCCLLGALQQFRAMYPGVRIRLLNRSAAQAISALQNGLADFAVVTPLGPLPEPVHCTELRRIREVAVCSASFSFLSGRTLTLRQLTRYPIIGFVEDSITHAFYSRLFAQEGLAFAPDIETNSSEHILPMVKSDLGIGFVPQDFLNGESEREKILVLTLENEIPLRSISLLWQEGAPLGPVARQLRRLLLGSAYSG